MMMREQQWDRSNCRHFRIDVCFHQRIYMRAFVNAVYNEAWIDPKSSAHKSTTRLGNSSSPCRFVGPPSG